MTRRVAPGTGGGLAHELVAAAGIVVLAGSLMTIRSSGAAAGLPAQIAPKAATSVVAAAIAPAAALAAEVGTKLGLPVPASRTVERITDAASGQPLR